MKTTRGEVVVKEHTAKKYQIPSTGKTITVSEKDQQTDGGEDDEQVDPTMRAESIGFKVTFPDGTVIRKKDAKSTMVATLRKLGLERVAKFEGRRFKDYPLVGRQKRTDGHARWQEEVDGWFIYINMSNATKINVLHMVAHELGTNITIEYIGEKTTD